MYSPQIDLLNNIHHASKKVSGRENADPLAIVLESVAIGAVIFLANASLRKMFRDPASRSRGR